MEPWPLAVPEHPWQLREHRVGGQAGREGDMEPGSSALLGCLCARSCFTKPHPYVFFFVFLITLEFSMA